MTTTPAPSADLAQPLIEGLLPDEALRRACLTLVADTLVLAHRNAPNRWSLTLRSERLRLHVGLIDVLAIRPNRCCCGVDFRQVPASIRRDPRVDYQEWVERPARGLDPRVPGSAWVEADIPVMLEILPILAGGHISLVVKAGLTARNAGQVAGHAPEAVAYLSRDLGRSLPSPLAGIGGAGATDTPTATRRGTS